MARRMSCAVSFDGGVSPAISSRAVMSRFVVFGGVRGQPALVGQVFDITLQQFLRGA